MADNWVALLGVKGGPAINPGGSQPTSNLLRLNGKTLVVDCGVGVALGLARQGVSLKEIDAIFITHLHSDHYLELGPLLHCAWTAGLKHALPVYAPFGTADYFQHFCEAMRSDIETRMSDEGRPDLRQLINFHVLNPDAVEDVHGISVKSMRTQHPPIADCFALRFEHRDTAIVFGADTCYFPPLADFAKGADLLVHEAMYQEGIDRLVARIGNGDGRLKKHMFASHTAVEDAGRIAAQAQVKALAINHMVPKDDAAITPDMWRAAAAKTYAGTIHVGHDGMRIPLSCAIG
jgi:ribonuclease BN (tRNA processing enzyme)